MNKFQTKSELSAVIKMETKNFLQAKRVVEHQDSKKNPRTKSARHRPNKKVGKL